MTRLIVEKSYEPPLTEEALAADSKRLGPCLERYGGRWVQSYLSADRRRMFCVFEGPDAETIRLAHRTAGVEFVRVWNADLLTPKDAGSASRTT